MEELFGGAEMAHERFALCGVEAPGLFVGGGFFHGHAHVLAQMFGPGGDLVFEPEEP